MFKKPLKFKIEHGQRESISISGKRGRKNTVLLKVGQHSISWRAVQLGLILIVFQFMDGFLTYCGLRIYGVNMEGNTFVRNLIHAYGAWFGLFIVKLFAVTLVMLVTVYASKRRWLRPIIVALCLIYLSAAIIPWVYILSKTHAQNSPIVDKKEIHQL